MKIQSTMAVTTAIAVLLSSCSFRENVTAVDFPRPNNSTFLIVEDGRAYGTNTNISEKTAPIESLSPSLPRENIELDRDQQRFIEVVSWANNNHLQSSEIADMVQAIALEFLGTPYQEGLLDRSDRETLVTALSGFDCVLFVETVVALSRSIAIGDRNYETFADHLQSLRYWNGHLNGYCSRLHYFSEWIADNTRRDIIENITPRLGGTTVVKPLNFMSQHWQSYPRMVSDARNYDCIVEMESSIGDTRIDYIPTAHIHRTYDLLRPGDIIAVATNIAGLDVTHTGLVYINSEGNVGMIHASPVGEVVISPDLQYYIENVSGAIGIMVARPVDPRS